ncbi:STAS/SEC14 domain-containing protein [Aquicoccus sp. G2-2]|jgi:hypothetical protein|uniref:STAS/SEC14 domain-containing protein n=1 Tax=Aquicoccus sp. G2-2 TaxID=3092120 RepID=UPI002ADF03D7|nr:STAS/SEC14 domain-containing protein [Aquicoccus sp. G2-2]MEA1113959.1 STAS/SEC14 domain-containing protein [Aquicoccus sp. G2-2]
MSQGQFEIIKGLPADVLGVQAQGKIDHDAYTRDLIPAIEAKVAEEGRVKLLYVLGDTFEGYSAGGAFEDAKLGALHLHDFARVAVVSDDGWISGGVRMFAPLMPGDVKVFPGAELEAAKAWISERDAPQADDTEEVAADHKLPMLEDKIPPDP